MAALSDPTLVLDTDLATDCQAFEISDDTGSYNATTNPGGYGGGVNIPSNSVQSNIIRIYQYGETVPTTFTFTVLLNVVTAATWTTPAGVVTNILADLTSTVWPFSTATSNTLSISNEWLGFDEDENISDQVWTISYEITGTYTNGGADYDYALITSNDELVDCNTRCCIKKMAAALKPNCCECGDKLMTYLKAKAMQEAAVASADVGEYDAAQKAIEKAAEICDNNCQGC